MPKDRKLDNFRVGRSFERVLLATFSATLAHSAVAETRSTSVHSILSTMNVAGGSETLQWQVAPSYSELFGLGVRGAIGGYVHEDFALGVIIDYAEHREEYLANAGVQLNDDLRIIGTIGLLKESEEFTLGAGREDVRQLQYGLSLKGSYNAGILRGFEINAYHNNANSDTGDVETGELTGLQLVTQLQPSASSDLRVGAGYERAEWGGGEVNEGFTLQAVGSQKLSDVLALQYSAKSGQTENSFGLGLSYDLSTPDVQGSALALSLERIDGKNGISDDTRMAVTWTVGLGASGARSSDTVMSSMGSISTMARKDLLAEVMTRPAFLPNRVMVRAATGPGRSEACSDLGVNLRNYLNVSPSDANPVFLRIGGAPNARIGLQIDGEQPARVTVSANSQSINLRKIGPDIWYADNLSLTDQWVGAERIQVTADGITCLANGVEVRPPLSP